MKYIFYVIYNFYNQLKIYNKKMNKEQDNKEFNS